MSTLEGDWVDWGCWDFVASNWDVVGKVDMGIVGDCRLVVDKVGS